jgi:hypothetical protein
MSAFREMFMNPDASFKHAQDSIDKALESNGVLIRRDEARLLYVRREDGFAYIIAELRKESNTLAWREGGSTKQQDKLIRAHASLFTWE